MKLNAEVPIPVLRLASQDKGKLAKLPIFCGQKNLQSPPIKLIIAWVFKIRVNYNPNSNS